ncbi:MAG TPA: hypothetical protein VF209_00360 [Patescibacteria group bacterium]
MKSEIREMFLEATSGFQIMLNEQDIKNDLKFATKNELQEFREEFQTFKEQNLTMLDQIMSELKAVREELVTGGYRQATHSDQLADHETRITTLELATTQTLPPGKSLAGNHLLSRPSPSDR